MYAYAFKENPDSSNFIMLNNFYNQYAIVDTLEYNPIKIEVKNSFSRPIWLFEESDSLIENFNLNERYNLFYFTKNKNLFIHSIYSGKLIKQILIPILNNFHVISSKNSDYILFSGDKRFYKYYFASNSFEEISPNKFLSADCIEMSDNGEFIAIANISQNLKGMNLPNNENILVLNKQLDLLAKAKVNFPYQIFNIITEEETLVLPPQGLSIDNSGSFIFIEGAFDNWYYNPIWNIKKNKILYPKLQDSERDNFENEIKPLKVKWDSLGVFFYSTADGKLRIIGASSEIGGATILNIEITDQKVFTCDYDGILNIYEYPSTGMIFGSRSSLTGNIKLIHSISTGKMAILDFIFNKETSQIFYYTKGYGVFAIDLKKRIKLRPDPSKIMDLILNKIGMEDLSEIEKALYKIY